MPQRHLQHLGITLPLRDTIGFGVQWVQDAQMGWGDAVEEVMTEGTNKPGAGLTGLPGKPISPFIPARPWGPWRGEKMKMRVLRAGAPPTPSALDWPRSSPWDMRRMVMVTYRGSHRSPQPWLPLRTAERERASQSGPPSTHCTGMCPPFLQCTHLFSFHLCSDHSPIGADDDAGLPFLPLQEKRKHEGRWRDQAPSYGGAGITTGTWWPVRMGDQECDHPMGWRWPGAVTFNPGEP